MLSEVVVASASSVLLGTGSLSAQTLAGGALIWLAWSPRCCRSSRVISRPCERHGNLRHFGVPPVRRNHAHRVRF